MQNLNFRKFATNQPDLQELFARFSEAFETQRDLLTDVRDLLAVLVSRSQQRDPLRQTFTLPTATGEPFLFSKRGYKHSRIRCPAAATAITVEEGGPTVALTLPAGWSVLDAAEGSRLWSTSTATLITIEWTDEVVQ